MVLILHSTKRDTLVLILKEIGKLKQDCGETWRSLSYNRAANSLKTLPANRDEIVEISKDIQGIGNSIFEKIEEYTHTGKIAELEKSKNELESDMDMLSVISRFSDVWGIGKVKAKKLYKMGNRSIDDLKKLNTENSTSKVFTAAQKIGLKYYSDFQMRIPRSEITRTWNRIHKIWMSQFSDVIEKLNVCGSYRRGEKNSGDIDILLCYKNAVNDDSENIPKNRDKWILTKLVESLKTHRIITDDLCLGKHKYMGVCKTSVSGKNKNVGRRLDLLVIPQEEYEFAMLHFTGSWDFNKMLRQIALKQGLTLSEHGLFTKDKKINKLPHPKNEEHILNFLNLEYIEPEKRDGKILLLHI